MTFVSGVSFVFEGDFTEILDSVVGFFVSVVF